MTKTILYLYFFTAALIVVLTSCAKNTKTAGTTTELQDVTPELAQSFVVRDLAECEDALQESSIRKCLDAIQNKMLTIDKMTYIDSMDAFTLQGDLYYKIGNYDSALSSYTVVTDKVGMRLPGYLFKVAKVKLQLKDTASAYALINEASEINSDFWYQKGNLFELQGNVDSAIYWYSQLCITNSLVYDYSCKRAEELMSGKYTLKDELEEHEYHTDMPELRLYRVPDAFGQ